MPGTVLVTGAAGFIGSTLVDRLLAEGRRVVGVDDLRGGDLGNLADARGDHPGAFEFHRLDVRDETLVGLVERHRPTTILHLAGAVDPGDGAAADAVSIDVVGTVRVLDAARRGDVGKVVLASDRLLPEGVTPTVRSVSARSNEAYLRAYGDQHGLRWTAVGLPNVYGPRGGRAARPGVVARFLDAQLASKPCTLHGYGRQTRDLLHVDDAVDALARAIANGDGRRVDVGSGQATSIRLLHDALRAATGSPHEPVLAEARVADESHPAVDNAAATAALGWRPFTSLEEGLAATVRQRRGA